MAKKHKDGMPRPASAPAQAGEKRVSFSEAPEGFAEGGIVHDGQAMLGFEAEPEMAVPADKIMEKAVPEAPAAPEVPADVPEKADVREEMVRILDVARGKRGIPTLVHFYSEAQRTDRYAVVDVNSVLLNDAWVRYREISDDKGFEEFLTLVCSILDAEVPRYHRSVAFLDLCR